MSVESRVFDSRVEFEGADGTALIGTLSFLLEKVHSKGPDTEESVADSNHDILKSKDPLPAPEVSHCILLLHGGMGHRDYLYHKHLTNRLLHSHGKSLAVFRFDYNGNGDSCGNRFFLHGFWEDIADAQCAMRMLRQAPFHLETICIVGHSVGAQHALQLAASSVVDRSKAASGLSTRGTTNHSSKAKGSECKIVPPLLVCVQPRYRLRYWYEEWERQCLNSPDGQWTMRWKSRGKSRSYTIQREDVELYSQVPMDDVSLLNEPQFGGGRLHILTIHGIARRNGSTSAKIMGYGSNELETLDGVVPVEDCTEVANRICCDRHTLRMVNGMDHYFRQEGAKDRLWSTLSPWLEDKLPLVTKERNTSGAVTARL